MSGLSAEHVGRWNDEATFFVELLEQLDGDYPSAAAVFVLLARQADIAFIPVSHRQLSAQLSECVPATSLLRALNALESLSLLQRRTHPSATTRYRIDVSALLALLATPLPEAQVIPGLTALPEYAGQNGAVYWVNTPHHFGPVTNDASLSKFFVTLLHALDQDYLLCATLYALLARQAGLGFVKASQRDLSASLGCCVSPRHVNRALATLESLELLERQIVSKKDIRYRVDLPALRALLALPLSPAEVIPGLTPLPALARIFVVDADPGEILEPLSEGIC
jgi:hypothetical protein